MEAKKFYVNNHIMKTMLLFLVFISIVNIKPFAQNTSQISPVKSDTIVCIIDTIDHLCVKFDNTFFLNKYFWHVNIREVAFELNSFYIYFTNNLGRGDLNEGSYFTSVLKSELYSRYTCIWSKDICEEKNTENLKHLFDSGDNDKPKRFFVCFKSGLESKFEKKVTLHLVESRTHQGEFKW